MFKCSGRGEAEENLESETNREVIWVDMKEKERVKDATGVGGGGVAGDQEKNE